MIADALVEYLEENSIGTVGTDIFIGELPLDKSDIIALVYSPSPDPDKAIPYFNQAIDIWARFKSYDEGYNKLKAIFDLLHRAENYDLEGFHVYLSYSRGMIEDLDRDAERRHLFKLSLAFVFREASEFS
jgi:hypothetical protein